MRITCPDCHTQYNLDPRMLGAAGQNVRCTNCGKIWFFQSEEERSFATADVVEDIMPSEPVANVPATFADAMAAEGHDFSEPAVVETSIRDVPSFVHSDIHVEAPQPFIDPRPFGLSAGALATMVAVFLFGVTFSGLLLAKNKIVEIYPPAYAFYSTIGAHIDAPGEGIRLSLSVARADKGAEGKTALDVSGKIENISGETRDYPSLRIVATNQYGAELRHWDFHPEKAVLNAGDAIPLNFTFEDLPPETATVDIHAIRH